MAEETYYQILGVHPSAPPEVIEAAYRRLERIYGKEYVPILVDGLPDDAAMDPEDRRWLRVQQAYEVLMSPDRRAAYDRTLREQRRESLPRHDLKEARKVLEPSGAWLADVRREEGSIVFRIGWAADFTETRRQLEQRIPPEERSYNPARGEWRVAERHEPVLVDLFDNFTPADAPPVPRLTAPVYPRWEGAPTVRRTWQPWEGWPLLVIGGLILAIVAAILFPANQAEQRAAQATATAVVVLNAASSFQNNFPTTPTPTPITLLRATLQYPSVYLRSGPSTDAPPLDILSNEQEYMVLGRTRDNAWLVLSTGEQTGWIAAWTVQVLGALEGVPVMTAETELPQVVPTPTPVNLPFP